MMNFWDQHKTIVCYYELLTKSVCDKYQLIQMEYNILMFLYNNPQYNTAADIVKVRKSTKSHVSTSLKCLEDRGFIEKKQSEENKKYVELFLLDDARKIVEDDMSVQKQFINNIFQGLTEEEIAMCTAIFRKICHNAKECLNRSVKGWEKQCFA